MNRLSTTEFIRRCNCIHKNTYDYSQTIYKNSSFKGTIICKHHGKFLQSPAGHLKGQGCPKCTHTISKSEIKFLDYVNIPNTNKNRQIKIQNFLVDGYNQKTKTIYEFLGDYWHGNPNNKRFNPNDTHPVCKITFKKLYKSTMNKLRILKSLGYTVKYIWESDWKKFSSGENSPPNIQTI